MNLFRLPAAGKAFAVLLLFVTVCFSQSKPQPAASLSATQEDVNSLRRKALELADKNLYLEAFPILEKIADSFPNDVDVWTDYGISLSTRAVTEQNPDLRKPFFKRAYEALSRAKKLGSENTIAMSLLDNLSPDGDNGDNFMSENPEVEKALREGEAFFGRGDYDKAFIAYEKAYKLDPKSYEAALFAGDCFYAQKKYAESEPWFAKAVAIDPDRDLAYRFWGDALLGQKKIAEAREKFIDGFIAVPHTREAWGSLDKLIDIYESRPDINVILPPANEFLKPIRLDESLLSQADGTIHWLKYKQTREAWQKELFKKQHPNENYRHSLAEEVAALNAVAAAAAADIKAGKIAAPHHSLKNLIEMKEKGFIEPYVLIFLIDDGIIKDYAAYREKNRVKLREFLSQNLFSFSKD